MLVRFKGNPWTIQGPRCLGEAGLGRRKDEGEWAQAWGSRRNTSLEPEAGALGETPWLRGAPARGLLPAQGWPPFSLSHSPPALSPRAPLHLSLSLSPHFSPSAPISLLRVLPRTPTILLSHLRSGFLRAGVHSHLAMVSPRPHRPGDRPGSDCSGQPDLVSHPSPEQEGEFPAPLAAQPPAQPGAAPCGQHAENGECPHPGSRRGQLEVQP